MMKGTAAYSRAVRIFTVFVFALLCGSKAFSQEGTPAPVSPITPQNLEKLHIMEDSLVATADSMYGAYIPDTRIGISEHFVRQLVRALKIPNSWAYPFDSLKKLINIIYADDNNFRIFNWEITPSQVAKRYYGAIQLPSENLKLIGLLDYTKELDEGIEDSILTGGKWFGALYYRIMSREVQGQKVYTLFGINQSSTLVTMKVLDVLTFTDRGVRFGAPIFAVASRNFPRQRINRFLLEYKKGVHAFMNWDSERSVIIFDRLVSITNDPGRRYTYAPSGEYDGFKWENDRWNYIQDLIPIQILKDGEAPSDEPK